MMGNPILPCPSGKKKEGAFAPSFAPSEIMRIALFRVDGCYRLEKRETLCRNDSIPETFQPRRSVRDSCACAGWFVGKLTLSHERGPSRPRLRLVAVRVRPADGEVHQTFNPKGRELPTTGVVNIRPQASSLSSAVAALAVG